MKKMVNKCGYVISPLGRMRRLGDLIIEGKKLIEKSKEFPRGSSEGKRLWIEGNRLIGRAERRSVNSPIQGLASDLALISLSLLHQYIIKNDLKWKIVNSVHDSVVIELRLSQVMKASKIIRKIFTRDSRKYAYKYFGWKMPTHIDIDFEIGQNKCWKCSKCGQLINYWKKSCDRKDKEGKVCGCTKLINHKLNSGYGTLVGWDETEAQLKEIQKGF
jgi:DNA polymerase I-like protein with 3'-5' exonuclease and polymerase domains